MKKRYTGNYLVVGERNRWCAFKNTDTKVVSGFRSIRYIINQFKEDKNILAIHFYQKSYPFQKKTVFFGK